MRIKADLQIHSICSDGIMGGGDIIRIALIRGLRAIAITDHNTFSGYRLAISASERIGASIAVIPGIEVRTSKGDLVVLCEKPVEAIEKMVGRDPGEVIDIARGEGCISYAPHPFDIRRLGLGEEIYRLRLDAIEIFNSLSDPIANRKARIAKEKLGVTGLSNSDAHTWEFVGVAYNIIEISEPRVEEILDGIRRGGVEAVSGRPGLLGYILHIARGMRRKSIEKCSGSISST